MTAIKTQDLQNIYSYLQKAGNDTSAASANNNFINTIFSSVGDFDSIANGNEQQKTSGIQNLLNKALSLIEQISIGNNETKKAKLEVNNNNKKAQELDKQVEQTKSELEAEINNITAELDGHIELIEKAKTNVEASSEELQAKLEALKTIQEQIQTKQAALKQSTKPEEQNQLLGEIKALASLIPALTANLSNIQQTLTEESESVANAYTEVETLKGNTVELQTNTEDKISSLVSFAANNIKNNIKTAATGTAQNIPTGAAATAAAEAASINFITSASAAKLFKVGNDQTGAGTIRISGAATTLQTLQQGIGNINNASNILASFNNAIGSSLGNFDEIIGSWNDTIEPIITSIGSIDCQAIEDGSKELSSAVDTDLAALETASKNENSNSNNTEIKNDLQTSKFDISKLGIKIEEE